MTQDFYVHIEKSINGRIHLVPMEDSRAVNPDGVDVMFAVRIGDNLVEAFTVRVYYVDDEPRLEIGKINPLTFKRVSGWFNRG